MNTNVKRTFNQDYNIGKKNEFAILGRLKEHFKDETIKQTINMFCSYDFESDNAIYELKSRKCYLNTFDTLIIGYNKLNSNTNKSQIFIWKFLDDRIAYIKYDKELFNKFELKPFQREDDRSDYIDKEQLCFYIPVNQVKIINRKCMVNL
jgi:hypothetical protein